MGEQLYTSRAGVARWKQGQPFYVWASNHFLYKDEEAFPVEVDEEYLDTDGLCSHDEYVVKYPSKAKISYE